MLLLWNVNSRNLESGWKSFQTFKSKLIYYEKTFCFNRDGLPGHRVLRVT